MALRNSLSVVSSAINSAASPESSVAVLEAIQPFSLRVLSSLFQACHQWLSFKPVLYIETLNTTEFVHVVRY
jgi:hypothetical protein